MYAVFFSSKINHGISIYVYDVTRPCSSALVSCMTSCSRGQCMRHISQCCQVHALLRSTGGYSIESRRGDSSHL